MNPDKTTACTYHSLTKENRESTEGYSKFKVEKGKGKFVKTGLNNWA